MEVQFDATVASAPHYFFGRRTQGEHEEFRAQTRSGPVDIIDNVAIAPPVPVRPGDRIQVRGDLVQDGNGLPVVHWTHHDPRGEHTAGFIRFDGRTYE